MEDKNALRWLFGVITFLIFILPILLADELSLFVSWLTIFISWFLVIAIAALKTKNKNSTTNNKSQ